MNEREHIYIQRDLRIRKCRFVRTGWFLVGHVLSPVTPLNPVEAARLPSWAAQGIPHQLEVRRTSMSHNSKLDK